MPWNSNNGGGPKQGGGRGGGPWGQGPRGGGSGGGRQQPPDLEELLRRGQDRFRRVLPSGKGLGAGGLVFLLLIIAAIWLFSGIYRVEAAQVGVVTRFGKFVRQEPPGLRWHLPWPIESVNTPNVTEVQTVPIGYRGDSASKNDIPSESLMITGDSNILDVDLNVLWVVASEPNSAAKFLFNVEDPEETVKEVGEAAMREVAGRTSLVDLQEKLRAEKEVEVRNLMQAVLNSYDAGIRVNQVQFQTVDPPPEVIPAFQDVQAARQDRVRFQNEAEAYANKIIPEAQGRAERIRQEAEAYREQTVAQANGEAQRFVAVYEQYRNAPDVTRRRIYLETLEAVMHNTDKVVIDTKDGSPGVVPYLPLNELKNRNPEPSSPPPVQSPTSGGGQ